MRNLEASAATRKRLTDAASTLFSSRSFYNTSVREIVAAAGVTKGAFYHHFDGKEYVLFDIQSSALDRILEECEAVRESEHSAAEEIRELIRIQLDVVSQGTLLLNREILLLGSFSEAHWPAGWETLKVKRDAIENYFVSTIERGIHEGEFRTDGDPRMLTYGILGMCYWIHVWYSPDGSSSINDIAEQFVDLALNGLRVS